MHQPHGSGTNRLIHPAALLAEDRQRLDVVSGRAPKDHIDIRILETMMSGIPLILGLGARM